MLRASSARSPKGQIAYQLSRLGERIWNFCYDLRFGAVLWGDVKTRFAELDANDTNNIPYLALTLIFRSEQISADDVLVDLGCGKGRVINWWLGLGLRNQIVGIELDPEVAGQTRHRLRKYSNVRIITGDAIENLPAEGTLIFLFNPFGEATVKRLRDRVVHLHRSGKIRIYYYNCVHADLFREDDRFVVDDCELIAENRTGLGREVLERLLEPAVIIRTRVDPASAAKEGPAANSGDGT